MTASVVLESSVQFALQSSMRAQEGFQVHFIKGLHELAEIEGLQRRSEIKACPPNLAGSLKRMIGRRCCLSSLTARTEVFER